MCPNYIQSSYFCNSYRTFTIVKKCRIYFGQAFIKKSLSPKMMHWGLLKNYRKCKQKVDIIIDARWSVKLLNHFGGEREHMFVYAKWRHSISDFRHKGEKFINSSRWFTISVMMSWFVLRCTDSKYSQGLWGHLDDWTGIARLSIIAMEMIEWGNR